MIYVVCKRTSSFWGKEVDVIEYATTSKEKAEVKLKELQERFALAVKVCEDWRADCKIHPWILAHTRSITDLKDPKLIEMLDRFRQVREYVDEAWDGGAEFLIKEFEDQ